MSDCHGDHLWRGSSTCQLCGERLRCICGVYVREDNLRQHEQVCPEVRKVESQ